MPSSFLAAPWPDLPLAPWRATRDTLHLWTQIVGKTLLVGPAQNHWWHTALRVSARGLETPPVAIGDRTVEVELDLVDHALVVRSDDRVVRAALGPRPVRAFYREYLSLLHALGVEVHLWPTPVEIPAPIPFEQDDVHRDYDPRAAHRFWQVLRRCDAALRGVQRSFVGKQSPVHFFWGSFDLALTRFSGRRAPERPGADGITREAYSHEVISFGFWPGGALPSGATFDEPVFYAYAAPQPEGFGEAEVDPPQARYDAALGEFVLPYEEVRVAPDPSAMVRDFCESVYAAGASLGRWDRAALERRHEHGDGAAGAAEHPAAP